MVRTVVVVVSRSQPGLITQEKVSLDEDNRLWECFQFL